MVWQLRDQAFRRAILDAIEGTAGRCALAGTVGVQIHMAAAIGLDKLGPPAHGKEIVVFSAAAIPDRIGEFPVERVETLGFDASIEARHSVMLIEGERFPVLCPEHILGLRLAAANLEVDAKWACFILMRTYEGRLDLEEVRTFVKRAGNVERQELLAELAYLAS